MNDIVVETQGLFLDRMGDQLIPLIKGSLRCEFSTLRVHRAAFSIQHIGIGNYKFVAECEIVVSRLLDGSARQGTSRVSLFFLPDKDGIKISFDHDRYAVYDDLENKLLDYVIPRYGRSEHAEADD